MKYIIKDKFGVYFLTTVHIAQLENGRQSIKY